MALSEYADWWDKQKKESEKILTEWVQDNPQWWTVGVATAVQTSMDLGQGMVDVLRFGQGMAEGGWRGVGKDAMRALVLLGPLGRAGGFLSRAIHVGRLRLAVQVAGVDGPCTFQAVNNAASILRGKNIFVTVRDMAEAMGTRVGALKRTQEGLYELGAWVDELLPVLRKLTKVKEVAGLRQLNQVKELAQRENGVTIFAIKATVRNAKGTEELLHSVMAVRRAGGRVGYGDYGGKLVNSLEELVTNLGYGAPTAIELYQTAKTASAVTANGMNLTGQMAQFMAKGAVLVIEGLTGIESAENGLELAAPAATMAAPAANAGPDAVPPEVVKGSLEAFKIRKEGKKVIRLPEIVIHAGKKVAPRAEMLTGVQFRLNALGFGAGPVDGIAGPKTKAAVTNFQKHYPPLGVDGIPGPGTQAKLVEVCGY